MKGGSRPKSRLGVGARLVLLQGGGVDCGFLSFFFFLRISCLSSLGKEPPPRPPLRTDLCFPLKSLLRYLQTKPALMFYSPKENKASANRSGLINTGNARKSEDSTPSFSLICHRRHLSLSHSLPSSAKWG